MASNGTILIDDSLYNLMVPLVPYKLDIEMKLSTTNFKRNVFIMIKYRKSNEVLRKFIVNVLKSCGFNGILANHENWVLTSDNVINPLAVLYCCKYGVAIFDEPDEQEQFNPSVAYELGIMHYQNKECLILINNSIADKKPFDIISKLHKAYDKELEVDTLITTWIKTLVNREKELTELQKEKIAVAIVFKPSTKEFLVTRRKYREGNLEWGFPSTRLHPWHNVEETLIFECKQETGITPHILTKLGERIHPDTGRYVEYWLCEYKSGDVQIKNAEHFCDVQWSTGADVLKKIETSLFEPVKDILHSNLHL